MEVQSQRFQNSGERGVQGVKRCRLTFTVRLLIYTWPRPAVHCSLKPNNDNQIPNWSGQIQTFNVRPMQSYSNPPIGLNPSSQIHPIAIDFVGDCNVLLLCDLVPLSKVPKEEDWSSDILYQFSSVSTGEWLNSNELFRDLLFDSPSISSNPFRKELSVFTKGKNVTGNRCCSSNVYRALLGETDEACDWRLSGEDVADDGEGVVICWGGVTMPSVLAPSLEDGRRFDFSLIKSVKRRVNEDFFGRERDIQRTNTEKEGRWIRDGKLVILVVLALFQVRIRGC